MSVAVMALAFVVMALGRDGCRAQKPNTDNKRQDVYIAGFFPYGKEAEHADTGRGVMPSVKLALDHVNEASSVLRNYRLHMWWNDTKCNAAVGVKAFFDMMHSGPHKLMLFGAACTHVTDPIAKASKRWHLTQLSYADTHPMFTKKNYPNFFRIVPSDMAFNPPRLSLLDKFNWTRVGTIYQNEPRYSLAHNRLVAELDLLGYIVVETQSFTSEVSAALLKLKREDTRVILGNFNEMYAREIFCEAYKLEMYGRRYQWIIMGTYSRGWWRDVHDGLNCTVEQMEAALEQTLLTDLLPLSTSGEITVSGITAEEYLLEYNSRRGREYSRFHGYTYDGIWAVALAIQNVALRARKNESVSDFRYRDSNWERLFLNALANTSFEGVTGPVRFYDNERKASILVKQFQRGDEVKVGEYNAVTGHLDLTLGGPLSWIGKHPPKDRTLRIIEHTRVNKTVYAILASLAVCGIIMAAVFLAFNIKYRNQRYIKMSSPQLNNLIIIGCMLTYTSIVFLGLDSGLSSIEAFPYICTARAWTLMAGFSLAFGAMFSKTWRVHSIFTDVKLNKKVIKDYQLFMVVGVLLFIDLAIMTTWQVADPFYRETKRLESHPHPSSEDIVIIPENEYCASEKMTIFIGSIYAYKGLLMIFGAFLAWETRHVSIPALNDSRHVGLSVYNVAIMCICGAAVALVLVDHQDAMFLIIGVFVIFCTTATLWLVFVPKMLELRRNPGGSIDKRFRPTLRPMSKSGGGGSRNGGGGAGGGNGGSTGGGGRRDSTASEMECKMREVKSANSKFRKALLDKESELQLLIKRLGTDARDLLETTPSGDSSNRLTVPLLKKDPVSATETTDLTSLCSLSSGQDITKNSKESLLEEKSQRDDHDQEVTKLNGNLETLTSTTTTPPSYVYNGTPKPTIIPTVEPREIKQALPQTELRRRCSLKNENSQKVDDAQTVCHRRVSVPVNKLIAATVPVKKKNECGTHVVAKSELWDTGNQHRCSKIHQKINKGSLINLNEGLNETVIHRSVSEKNKYSQKKTLSSEKIPTKPQEDVEDSQTTTTAASTTSMPTAKPGYFQSTPNVAAAAASAVSANKNARTSPSSVKKEKSIYNATSESELLDREILPIFQKLLTERNKSQQNIDYSFGRSCPNISIKCDIVEYL